MAQQLPPLVLGWFCAARLGPERQLSWYRSRTFVRDGDCSMAAPVVSAGSLGNSPTAAGGRLPHGGGPDLDFRSGARMEDLNRLIQEFSKHDQREYDDQRALEIHTAKDFIFSMLGEAGGGPRGRGGKQSARGRETLLRVLQAGRVLML